MSSKETEDLISYFRMLAPHLINSIVASTAPDDPDEIHREAATEFAQLVPHTPYADRPDHVMAGSMYFCMATLAFKNPVRTP